MKRRHLKIVLVILLLAVGVSACQVSRQMGATPDITKFYGLDYFDGEAFVNVQPVEIYWDRVTGGDIGFTKFIFKSENAPHRSFPKVMLTADSFPEIPEDYALYWLGHSSAIIELDGKRMLIDPVMGNAAPVSFAVKRYDDPPLPRKEIPPVDYVLISHDHYDHLEYATMRFLRNREITFIVPLGVGAHLIKWGISEDKIHELGWGDSFSDGTVTFTAETASHYSGRRLNGRGTTLWVSYIIEGTQKKIFWSGDTGYWKHFREIGEKYGPFDLAAMEMDAWNPGWPNIHMFPEEAVKAAVEVNAGLLLPIHWGVFDLAMHPWDESIRILVRYGAEYRMEIVSPMMGERVVPGETLTGDWWNY